VSSSRETPSTGNRARNEALQAAIAQAAAQDGVRGSGRPLDAATRGTMEQRFGEDFGDVRLHDGPRARRSAQALQARAFTFGPHIVFEHASFATDSDDNRRLLAHELGHVLQQRRGGAQGSRERSTPAHEDDAHAAADKVLAGKPARVQRSSGPQPQREGKNKNADAFYALPPQMVEDLKRQGLFPADAQADTLTYGDLSPDMAEAVSKYFKIQQAKSADPEQFILPLLPPNPGSTPSLFFGPSTPTVTFPSLNPVQFGWQYTPPAGTTAAVKKPAAHAKPAAPVMNPPGGFPTTQANIEALDDSQLFLEMKLTLEWLRKQKESSGKVEQVARYYQGLSRAYNHRKSELELKRAQIAAPRTPQQQVLTQNVRLNLRAELAPAFSTMTDEIAMPGEVLDMLEGRDESFPADLQPAQVGKGPGTLGFFSMLDTSPTAQPRFLDNFKRFGYDGMSRTYVLTFGDGTEVSIARRVVEDPSFDISQAMGHGNSGVYVFKAKGGSKLGVALPPRLNASTLPNFFAAIEENRQAIENADAGAFVGRNLLTYEDIPGSDTVAKITFGLSLAKAGTPIGVASWQKYRNPQPRDAGPGLLPPPRQPSPGQPVHLPFPTDVGNDNAMPMTPMARTGTGDFFYPIPQPRPLPQLRLAPSPELDAPPLWQPFQAPMASAGGSGGGGHWSFGGWGGYRGPPTTDVSSAKLAVGGTWSAQSKRQTVLKAQQAQVETEIATEIDRINTRRGSISASDWKDQRAGLTKRLYNLREQQHALKIALQKPENIVLTQIRVLGVVDSAGTFSTTESVAGSGRIPDIGVLQPKGSLRLLDSKTASEVVHSITKRGAPRLKPSSPIGKQVAKEDALRAHGGDWVLQGTDVATGESFTFRMSNTEIDNSRPVPYGQHDN
jgi:hypothetical protein